MNETAGRRLSSEIPRNPFAASVAAQKQSSAETDISLPVAPAAGLLPAKRFKRWKKISERFQ